MTERNKRILLSPPHLSEDDGEYIEEALATNWIAPVGPNIDAFEREIAEKVGVEHACALNSGTAAIHLGLMLLDVKPGDIVLCSSLTFVASANPIRYLGAEPYFIDSEPETWCMSPSALENALEALSREGRSVAACVVVSLYGQCAKFEAIERTCGKYGVKIMDEAAESLGASDGTKMAGTFGDLGVYSFNGNKIITTSGGGALISNDETKIRKAKSLASQSREHSSIGAYEHHVTGFNYGLSNLLAGLGRSQLRNLDRRIRERRRIFNRYRSGLEKTQGIEWMPDHFGDSSTRWLTTALLQSEAARDRVIHELDKNDIEARPVWKPMHLQKLFAGSRYQPHSESRDVSQDLFRRGICLPSGSSLSPRDQDRIIEVVAATLS